MKKNLEKTANSFNKAATEFNKEEIKEINEIQNNLGENEICLIEVDEKNCCVIISKP